MADRCTFLGVKEHVSTVMQQETSKMKQAIDSHLEDEIHRFFRQENDRDRRKYKIVAYGIPLQSRIDGDKSL